MADSIEFKSFRTKSTDMSSHLLAILSTIPANWEKNILRLLYF